MVCFETIAGNNNDTVRQLRMFNVAALDMWPHPIIMNTAKGLMRCSSVDMREISPDKLVWIREV